MCYKGRGKLLERSFPLPLPLSFQELPQNLSVIFGEHENVCESS
jgi:hypothetical protein